VLSESEEFTKENLRLASGRMELSELAQKVSKVHGISQAELRSGSRRREAVEARKEVSWLAVNELGYSGTEVARYLGVTTSWVTRAVS
jgi:chromosomal replication initiation ATPase DnaA